MAMDPERQKQLNNLRSVAPHVATLAEKFVEKEGQNPALDSAGRKFTELATPTALLSIWQINNQLDNPQTLAQVTELIERDPAKFEKVLPQIFDKPETTAALVQQQLAAVPGSSMAAASGRVTPTAQAAPVQQTPVLAGGTAKPTQAAAPAATTPAPAAPAAPNPALAAADAALSAVVPSAEAAAPKSDVTPMAAFLGFLEAQDQKTPGVKGDFTTFIGKVEGNEIEGVSNAYRAVLAGQSTPEEQTKAFDDLKKEVEADPQFFAKINRTMDQHPGLLNGLGNDIMNIGGGGKGALKAIVGVSQVAQSSFLQQGPFASLGQMLLQFLGDFFAKGGLSNLVNGLLGKVGVDFALGTNGKDLQVQSNSGGKMARQALNETDSKPASVTVQTPDGSKQAQTGEQFTSAPTPSEAERKSAAVLQQQLGMTGPAVTT